MDVIELQKLSTWFLERTDDLEKRYSDLLNPVLHNSKQPQKQELQPYLSNLLDYLESMTFDALSLEQLAVLKERDVLGYLGREGARFVGIVIKSSSYDPVTAAKELQTALDTINGTARALRVFSESLHKLSPDLQEFEASDEYITIKVGFRNEASIRNVVDLKRAAADWHDIMRGLALASGEAPEATRVVGAGTGSILLYLAATPLVTLMLARISKHLTGIAKDIIGVEAAREELRHSKILNKAIEAELDTQVQGKKASAVATVIEEVKKDHPAIDGGAINALTKAVDNLLAFSRKGGGVDFISPMAGQEDEEESDEQAQTSLIEAREAIRDYNVMRESVRLLTTDVGNDNQNGEDAI